MQNLIKWIHLNAIIVWVGSIVFFSFFAAPAVFKTLSKEQAGDVISVMISKYYWVGLIAGSTALISSLVLTFAAGSGQALSAVDLVKTGLLVFMLGLSIYAGFIQHPKVQQTKVIMRQNAGTPIGDAAKEKFGKQHRLSMICNVLTLLGGIGVTIVLASKLKQ